jgi:hypothetical protein
MNLLFYLVVPFLIAAIGILIKLFVLDINVQLDSVDKEKKTIFDFNVDSIAEKVDLSQYRGKKAYLIVNVASNCGLTDINYLELQELYEKYK